ncbi:MAG TPA: 30S ribosomal protein S2, partial [Spirochaetia bacterium]
IKEMKELPGIVFIIDTRKESIAVTEARKVGVPIAAVVDTNCNPEGITFPIPGNDDAIRAINLFAQIIANAVIEAENEVGLEVVETLQEEKGEEEFAEAIDKGEFAAQSKYDQEEDKVAVAAALGGSADDSATGYTDKDYSNYNPDEGKKEEAPSLDEPEIDEDKLYKE